MEDEHKRKVFYMKIGTIIVVVLLFLLWTANLKNVWREADLRSAPADTAEWDEFRNEMQESLAEIREKIDEANAEPTQIAPPATEEDKVLLEDIFKETAENVSTQAPDQVRTGCPEWINCMPTFDGPPPNCKVPLGCEDITQIAY